MNPQASINLDHNKGLGTDMCMADILFWLHSVIHKKSVFRHKVKNGRTGFWNLALQLTTRIYKIFAFIITAVLFVGRSRAVAA